MGPKNKMILYQIRRQLVSPKKTKMDVNRTKTQDENEIMKKHKR